MKHQIFCIHDNKAQAYLPPFIMHRNDMAVRVFADCINSDEHQFGKNPGDYTLFNIGEFDDNKALIKPRTIISLGNGVEFITHFTDPDQEQLNFNDPPIGDLSETILPIKEIKN